MSSEFKIWAEIYFRQSFPGFDSPILFTRKAQIIRRLADLVSTFSQAKSNKDWTEWEGEWEWERKEKQNENENENGNGEKNE